MAGGAEKALSAIPTASAPSPAPSSAPVSSAGTISTDATPSSAARFFAGGDRIGLPRGGRFLPAQAPSPPRPRAIAQPQARAVGCALLFDPQPTPGELVMNDIGEVRVRTAKPLVFDGYYANRLTGSFILIEPGTNATVGAGMLFPPTEAVKPEYNDFAI